MFGYSAVEALGMPVAALVPDQLKDRHHDGLARFHATGHGHIVDARSVIELPALRRSGEEMTIELSLNPVHDAPVGGPFVLAIIRDVTERSRLRSELERRLRD